MPSGTDPVVDRLWPAPCLSALLGATAAMFVWGVAVQLQAASAEKAPAGEAVVGAALAALSVGVRIPQRLALWLCALAWRRVGGGDRTLGIAHVLLTSGSSDRPLYWSALSVVALAAGLLIALAPVQARLSLGFLEWMHAHFLWSRLTLIPLDFATALIAAGPSLLVIGLAVSGAHRLSGRHGQWDTRASGWVSIGAATGVLGAEGLSRVTQRPVVLLVAASLPALVAAVIAASAGGSGRDRTDEEVARDTPAMLPLWSDRWPTLLRGSIVAVGACGAAAMTAWWGQAGATAGAAALLAAMMLAALGLGVLAGCRPESASQRSIGGFGVACAAAGLATAAGVAPVWGDLSASPVCTAGVAAASLGTIGFATAYGRQTLLHRVAGRTAEGAKVLARLLASAALTVWLAAPAAVHVLGRPATLMLLALSLLALGGTLIIHEPGHTLRTRRLRLCAVFGSLGGMIAAVLMAPPRARPKQADHGPSQVHAVLDLSPPPQAAGSPAGQDDR